MTTATILRTITAAIADLPAKAKSREALAKLATDLRAADHSAWPLRILRSGSITIGEPSQPTRPMYRANAETFSSLWRRGFLGCGDSDAVVR